VTKILPHLKPLVGKHPSPEEGVCIMEILSLALGVEWINGRWYFKPDMDFTDLPACTHTAIAVAAQRTWDSAGEAEPTMTASVASVIIGPAVVSRRLHVCHRRMMAKFLPRLLRAKAVRNHRIEVRIALAAARYVERMHPQAALVNDAVEAWLDGEVPDAVLRAMFLRNSQGDTPERSPSENAREAAEYAVKAALDDKSDEHYGRNSWATQAVICASYAAQYASLLLPGEPLEQGDMEAFLDYMLDAHEKACAEEGEMAFEPEPWEADAIEFVDRLMSELAEAGDLDPR